jgi:hypothetical protein
VFERTGGAGGGRLRGPGMPLPAILLRGEPFLADGVPLPARLVRGEPFLAGGVPSSGFALAVVSTMGGAPPPPPLARRPPPFSSRRWAPDELMLVCLSEIPLFDLSKKNEAS